MTRDKEMMKKGWGIILAQMCLIIAYSIMYNYGSYVLTDVVKLDVGAASTIMTISNVCAIIGGCAIGAIVNNTRSRWGQCRPWIWICIIGATGGSLLVLISYLFGGAAVVFVAIGYICYQIFYTAVSSPKFGLYLKMAGGDSAKRDYYSSMSWTGFNGANIIAPMLILPLVGVFAFSGEQSGYVVTQIIFVAIGLLGAFILTRISRHDDVDNRNSRVQTSEMTDGKSKEDKVSILSMCKSFLMNRIAIAIALSDICRYCGGVFLIYMISYQCEYVLGDIKYSSICLTTAAIAAVVGSYITPLYTKFLGGRKRVMIICTLTSAMVYLVIAFAPSSMTPVGFIVGVAIAYFIAAPSDVLAVLIYGDAAEYWQDKTGEDVRTFLLGSQNMFINLGMSLAATAFGIALTTIGYQADVALTQEGMVSMTRMVGIIPGVAYVFSVAVLLLHHKSDKEMVEIIERNEKKYGNIAEA